MDIKTNLKLDAYTILSDYIEQGIDWGYNRAHKHTDTPTEDHLKQQIHHYIMLKLTEIFKFDDNE